MILQMTNGEYHYSLFTAQDTMRSHGGTPAIELTDNTRKAKSCDHDLSGSMETTDLLALGSMYLPPPPPASGDQPSTPESRPVSTGFNWRVVLMPKMMMFGFSILLNAMGGAIVFSCLPPYAVESGTFVVLSYSLKTTLSKSYEF